MKTAKIDLRNLENSLKSLTEALHPQNLLERDGAIQRFEFTFEMSWKMMAKVLQADRPLTDNSVRGILREAGRQGLIESVEVWFSFQDARNQTSHTYDPAIATTVFEKAGQFPALVTSLIATLQKRIASS
jgi:nucleotidyltransferase substrate binding protein (TIGR01987 family)